MRIKKGFTLAEILIVLMVIGIIATMTVPGLMAGVQEAQFRTAYKKAYNTIVNYAAMASVEGSLPAKVDAAGAAQLYVSMARNLSVKGFIKGSSAEHTEVNSGLQGLLNKMTAGLKTTAGNVGSGTMTDLGTSIPTDKAPVWIVTEDNFSYTVVNLSGATCSTKLDINALTDSAEPYTKACYTLVVDVNGLNKGPNLIQYATEATTSSGSSYKQTLSTSTPTPALKNDQYYIYIARDGATAGNPTVTMTGRIIADIKNAK